MKTVLITGCSDGGLGAALAFAFKDAGYRVVASARNTGKMASVKEAGIETIELDVVHEDSIAKAVRQTGDLLGDSLDILVNNAGAGIEMPVMDLDLQEVRKLFELNVFSLISVSRAFLPLLRRSSQPMIVNNTSIAGSVAMPFQAAYSASKSAAAMLTHGMRLELEPFSVKVVELKTGSVESNFFQTSVSLPETSMYRLGKDLVENISKGEPFRPGMVPASSWAAGVVADLSKANPPYIVWRGGSAQLVRYGIMLPLAWLDNTLRKMGGLDVFEKRLKSQDAGVKQS